MKTESYLRDWREKLIFLALLPLAVILSPWFLFEEFIYRPLRGKYRLWRTNL